MRTLLPFITGIILLGLTGTAWACPGGDENDPGVCDTLYVICHDSVQVNSPPWEVHFPLLVTNDIVVPTRDSIAHMWMAFDVTHTNPAAYCSIPYWKNTTVLYPSPDTGNSVFRHFGGMQNRMMYLSEQMQGLEWDTRIVDVQTGPDAHFWFSIWPVGWQDQRWWEGSRVLLATMTFVVSDSMTIHIDNGWWPPTGFPTARFVRSDAASYSPRQNVPYSVKISSGQRGDANGDGQINVSDALYMLNYLFRHGSPPVSFEAGDANCDDDHGALDVIFLLNYLFRFGPAPGCS